MSIYFVFYRNKGLGAKIIQWWTKSRFNHCELWNGNELIGVADKPTTIRIQSQKYLNPTKWEVFEVLDSTIINTLNTFYNETKGLKYDNKAIWLSNFFNRGEQDKDKYTCSEWCAELINRHYNIIYPRWFAKFNPQDVLDVLLDKKLVKKVELDKYGLVEKRWRTDI